MREIILTGPKDKLVSELREAADALDAGGESYIAVWESERSETKAEIHIHAEVDAGSEHPDDLYIEEAVQ